MVKKTKKRTVKTKNPKVGQFVWDKHEGKKRKVMAVPNKNNNLYFIGAEHEPVRRNEFVFPLKNK